MRETLASKVCRAHSVPSVTSMTGQVVPWVMMVPLTATDPRTLVGAGIDPPDQARVVVGDPDRASTHADGGRLAAEPDARHGPAGGRVDPCDGAAGGGAQPDTLVAGGDTVAPGRTGRDRGCDRADHPVAGRVDVHHRASALPRRRGPRLADPDPARPTAIILPCAPGAAILVPFPVAGLIRTDREPAAP
jgi:hypothetical protein